MVLPYFKSNRLIAKVANKTKLMPSTTSVGAEYHSAPIINYLVLEFKN
jgi:hypothetical protein